MRTKTDRMRGVRPSGRGPLRDGGFSLVEVLIAIFVLALGLLGLAAVFPAVVRQQRAASDAVQGISMQRSIEDFLKGHALLAQSNEEDAQGRVTPRGWALLARDRDFSRGAGWVEANQDSSGRASGVTIDPRSGTMFVGRDGLAGGVSAIEIPLAERLIPRPTLGGRVQPRFVWDFIARRVAAGRNPPQGGGANVPLDILDDDTIQLAVFVRRIDQAIRVPAGSSLAEILTQVGGTLPAVPVAEDMEGRPTFDGIGGDTQPRYSPIRAGRVEVVRPAADDVERDVITMLPMAEELRPFLEQLGQKFVDANGIVHEVVRVERGEPGTAARLTIAPPIEASLVTGDRADVLYTPQVPASVSVISIRR
jgi:prepilin-type N-terminal cleavage/methylation domain-containing protein